MGDHCVTVWSDSDKQISSLDLSSAFSHQFGHFRARNDVTVAVRSRIWYFFVCKPTKLLWEIIVSQFEVILTSRSRVWTWAAHFPTNLVILGLEMTSQWRSEAEFDIFLSVNQQSYYGRSLCHSLKWFWQADLEFGLEQRIFPPIWSF